MWLEKTQGSAQAESEGKTSKESKGKVGASLLRLQQSFPEEGMDEDASLQDFFRELQKPRSREYIEQALRCMELSRRIAELKEELEREKKTGKKSESPEGENPRNKSGNREGGGPSEDKLSEKQDMQESKPAPAWLPKAATGVATVSKTIEWKGKDRTWLQEELDRLEWELKQQQKQLYDRLPKGDPYLTSVFWMENEAELLRRGILAREGVPYDGVEELIQRCNAKTQQECNMLNLADRALNGEPSPLVVEVYLHAVCKVFGNGTTQLIRG